MEDPSRPLLNDHQDEEQRGFFSSSGSFSLKSLLSSYPDQLVRYIKTAGVRKLGDLHVQDVTMLRRFNELGIRTLGRNTPMLDWEATWRRELNLDAEKNPSQVHSSATTPLHDVPVPRTSQQWWGRVRAAVQAKVLQPALAAASWKQEIHLEVFEVTLHRVTSPRDRGLLQPLLKRWQAGGCSGAVFGMPAVQAVIDFKWRRYAKRLLLAQLACYLVWLVSFCLFMVGYQDEEPSLTLQQLLSTSWGAGTVMMNLLSLLAMIPFLAIESATLLTYGKGWLSAWNAVDLCTYLLQVAITVMHTRRVAVKSWLSVAVAVQCILLWVRLLYFSKAFRSTRFDLVESMQAVLVEVRWYLLVMLLLMWGFACGFYTLFRQDPQAEQFETLPLSVLTMFSYAVGGATYSLGTMTHSHNPLAATLLIIIYQFVVSMLLMSLLIGVMTTALTKVTSDEWLQLLTGRAQIIDEIEAVIPDWVHRRLKHRWYPKHLYVLRVNPKSIEQVEQDYLWTGVNTEPSRVGSQPSVHNLSRWASAEGSTGSPGTFKGFEGMVEGRMEQLERQVQEMKDVLGVLVQQLQRTGAPQAAGM